MPPLEARASLILERTGWKSERLVSELRRGEQAKLAKLAKLEELLKQDPAEEMVAVVLSQAHLPAMAWQPDGRLHDGD
jgi:hypothetical protein